MVAGLGFIVAVIGLMAVPFHAAQLARGVNGGVVKPWVFAGAPVGLILGVLAVVLPLRAGARSLRDMEF